LLLYKKSLEGLIHFSYLNVRYRIFTIYKVASTNFYPNRKSRKKHINVLITDNLSDRRFEDDQRKTWFIKCYQCGGETLVKHSVSDQSNRLIKTGNFRAVLNRLITKSLFSTVQPFTTPSTPMAAVFTNLRLRFTLLRIVCISTILQLIEGIVRIKPYWEAQHVIPISMYYIGLAILGVVLVHHIAR
jgi:hypothetical protein